MLPRAANRQGLYLLFRRRKMANEISRHGTPFKCFTNLVSCDKRGVKHRFEMKGIKTFPWLMAILAAVLCVGITGCTKQVDLANYSAGQWTNDINAAKLTESEFVRL